MYRNTTDKAECEDKRALETSRFGVLRFTRGKGGAAPNFRIRVRLRETPYQDDDCGKVFDPDEGDCAAHGKEAEQGGHGARPKHAAHPLIASEPIQEQPAAHHPSVSKSWVDGLSLRGVTTAYRGSGVKGWLRFER